MPPSRPFRAALPTLACASLALSAAADLTQEWATDLTVGTASTANITGLVVDEAGVSYVCAITGSSTHTDILTAAIGPDGAVAWSDPYDGPLNWTDQAWDIALGPGGVVWVAGGTLGAGTTTNVLLLKYDATTGTRLATITYTGTPAVVSGASSVATDALGNVFVAGFTHGADSQDALLVKFDAAGAFLWARTWDGPLGGTNSRDLAQAVRIDPNGDPVSMIDSRGQSGESDYVVVKYASADGAQLWETTWGLDGTDWPLDMEIDAAGDVYVAGTGTDGQKKYSTLKLRAADGQLLWQEYDSVGVVDFGNRLALDDAGGVYVSGFIDLDGTNTSLDVHVVKRDAATGAHLWGFRFGQSCGGCLELPGDLIVDGEGRVYVGASTGVGSYGRQLVTLVLDGASGFELERGIAASADPNESTEPYHLALDPTGHVIHGGRVHDFVHDARLTVVKYAPYEPPGESYCIGAANSVGAGARIGGAGSPSVALDAFRIQVEGAPPHEVGQFFYGPARQMIPFGDGWRCVGGPTFRLAPMQTTDGAGSAERGVEFTQSPAGAGPGRIHPGSRWHFQFWYRDLLAGGAQFNLSDAVAVDFEP